MSKLNINSTHFIIGIERGARGITKARCLIEYIDEGGLFTLSVYILWKKLEITLTA
jgi:hypothetical protein